jgi:integrase
MDKVDQAIEQANQGLNRVKICRRGHKLSLRGSLPKKPGEGRGNRQQTIALGIFANPEGVKVALAKAQRLESDLNLDRFSWPTWLDPMAEPKTAIDWAQELANIKKSTISATSFESNYREPLESLPSKPLTEEMLIAHILSRSQPNTWTRNNDCMVFKQVAKQAGITVDFSGVKGRYRPTPLSPDDIPSDEEIEATWKAISTPGWQWVYGMLATYGLRPHEAFKLASQGLDPQTGKITILEDSKTGRRDVWPLPEKWRSLFDLDQIKFPNIRIEGRNNRELGQRISANLKIPHHPYALRHAWAIRSAVMGVPDSIAARWMGHSVAVHSATYHAAIDQLHHEQIWRRANSQGNSI